MAKASSILKGEKGFITQLQQWLGEKCKWNLCYRASRDGWSARNFHRNCDSKGPTVVLIKVNEFIFGGYTDQNWAGTIACLCMGVINNIPISFPDIGANLKIALSIANNRR